MIVAKTRAVVNKWVVIVAKTPPARVPFLKPHSDYKRKPPLPIHYVNRFSFAPAVVVHFY